MIDPRDGGTLTNNNGSVQLAFPTGAVAEPVTVSYAPIATGGPSGAVGLAGFALTARTASGATVAQFDKPLVITVRYDPAQLGGVPESAIQIFFQKENGDWVALVTTVDTIGHVATATVDHLTMFGAFASPGGPVPPGPTGTPTATPVGTPVDLSAGHTTCQTALPLGLDTTFTGYLLRPGEEDWFTIQVTTVPFDLSARLLGGGPDFQVLLTANCGQGLNGQAVNPTVPVVPIGESRASDQGWLTTASLTDPGTYQLVVRSEKRGFSAAAYSLHLTGAPASTPTATATPPARLLFLPSVSRGGTSGW